ncbi:hypothetical protein [Rhizobium sp. RCC_161_2]|uniref:hypothetical protein n=1 Tax=Rhizobium sp. RCC_161_2 TaxID=3239219 RepID=UPI003525CEE1
MRVFLSVLALTLAIAILAFLQWTTPTYALLTGPLETRGDQSATVSSETFDVKVNEVLLAKTLALSHFGRPVERDTEGIWVVVSAEMQSKWETMQISSASIKGASGRIYAQSTRASGTKPLLTSKDLQPGLPAKGVLMFEMPEQEAHDMELILSRKLGPQLDSEIHVKLDANAVDTKDRLEIRDDGVHA